MTLIFTDPVFLEHETGRHPESPARLKRMTEHLESTQILSRMTKGKIRSANEDELTLVHDADHVREIMTVASNGGGRLDPDTVASPASFRVASLAAGTTFAAVDEVMEGRHKTALCLIRPPGHHALTDRAMGFCLFNNVSLAARYAQKKHDVERVLIVDWDVHHGNGTQDIFYDDGTVFFFSAHRYPFYPGSGSENETGRGRGQGAIFNLPIPYGTPRKSYLEQFTTMLTQSAEKCRPQLVLISAGFDAHKNDPIGSLDLETEDFEPLTKLVLQVADQYADGKVVSLLEGGYNVDALAESVGCHLETMLAHEAKK
ncbi:MAG: histone deacetylase [Planctomycetota bacterium]|nr:histone deacetylase [Planctomycetota bacterium]MDA1212548.1 histone deacetylase [Planctomycetota bacterium]